MTVPSPFLIMYVCSIMFVEVSCCFLVNRVNNHVQATVVNVNRLVSEIGERINSAFSVHFVGGSYGLL